MSVFLYILGNNIIPIFIIIGLGYLLSKKFEFSIMTLSKLIFYLFTPAYIFYNLYTTDLSMDMFNILFFCMVYLACNYLLATIMAKIRHYDLGLTNAFRNSLMFNNSGNIGLSLITLVFGSAPFIIDGNTPFLSQALAAQVIVMVFMNITINTIGIFNAGRAKKSIKHSLLKIFTMPSIYTVPLALLLKYLRVDITPAPIWPAVVFIKSGLVPMALLTLGVQLSITKFSFKNLDVNLAALARIVIGPVMALILIKLFGFTGVIAQTMLISSSVPTAVNTALIAVECDNQQGFAAQEVMVSTIYSAVTLSLAIYLARMLFPVI